MKARAPHLGAPVFLALILATPGGLFAQGVEAQPAPARTLEQRPPEEARRGDGRRTVSRLPGNLLGGAVGVFHADNLRPVVIGAAATGVGSLYDDEVAAALADPEHDVGQSLETGGQPLWSGGAVAALFIAGRFSDAPRFRAFTYDWLEAFLLNGAYTEALKVAVGRERPNGEDTKSFPSGHASNAFTLAAVAERHFGWKAGVPAYGLAAAVALSRIQRDKHYLSDVMAGATLGYIVGRTVGTGEQPAGSIVACRASRCDPAGFPTRPRPAGAGRVLGGSPPSQLLVQVGGLAEENVVQAAASRGDAGGRDAGPPRCLAGGPAGGLVAPVSLISGSPAGRRSPAAATDRRRVADGSSPKCEQYNAEKRPRW